MSSFGDRRQGGGPQDPGRLRVWRVRIVAAWFVLSVWDAVPISLAFMRRSEAVCWMPVAGTAAVWAWDIPW